MTIDNADNKAQKRRKVRAILASGLVLGVGAAVTLAAWNDSVWGKAEFGTGANSWNVQGNFTGASDGWNEFVTANAAGSFNFGVNASALVPGDTVYAKVGLRVVSESLGANITMPAAQNATNEALAGVLDLKVASIAGSSTACDAAAVNGTTRTSGKVGSAAITAPIAIPAKNEHWLCFAVTLPAGTTPGQLGTANEGKYSTSVNWEFKAASTEPANPTP